MTTTEKIWLAAYPPGTPAEIELDERTTLVTIFEESCRRYADRPAYHNLGVVLTFSDLDRLSRQFAAHLQAAGLRPGDRIALMMPNVLQYPVALFGALRAGLIVVNTNPLYTARELRHQLRDSGARAIVILENFAHVLQEALAETEVSHVIVTGVGDLAPFPKRAVINFVVRRVRRMVRPYQIPGAVRFRDALARGANASFEAPPIRQDDIAFLQYTGGTTGTAKGTVLTHRNLVANLQQVAAFWKDVIQPGQDVVITALPLYHVFCLTCNCLVFTQHGGLNVLITNPRDIAGFVRELRKWRFTIMTGVNTLFNALLEHPDFRRIDFSSLKLAVAGGMALQPAVAERWRAVTGKPMVEGYGLTEASPVVACNPREATRLGSIGVPLPSTDVMFLHDGRMERLPGITGELCVRGPQVMRGYWNKPEETQEKLLPDGWLRTGDVATMDEDGYLRIVDRVDDVINVSGFNVYPNEVESVLAEHPAVLEAGCIGVPDEHSGQAVKAVVVTREGMSVSAEELREFCRQRLTRYKVPRYVEFRPSLPKTNVGKVLRRALAEPQAAGRGT